MLLFKWGNPYSECVLQSHRHEEYGICKSTLDTRFSRCSRSFAGEDLLLQAISVNMLVFPPYACLVWCPTFCLTKSCDEMTKLRCFGRKLSTYVNIVYYY